MRISRTDKINNIPIKQIRDFLMGYNYGYSRCFIPDDVSKHFNLNEINTKSLIKELLKEEYITRNKQKNRFARGDYLLDDKGSMLCSAKLIPPINKEKADKIFIDFLQRVHEINSNDYYLVKVQKLYLFGSYLDKSRDDYNDIDIFYKLKRKISNWNIYNELRQQRISDLANNGKYLKSFAEELKFPETEVLLKMKNKCRYLSLQPLDVDLLKLMKHKLIFPQPTKK